MKKVLAVSFCMLFVSSVAQADIFGTGINQFEIEFVNISGDASSFNGTNISQYSPGDNGYRTFADPDNNYRMGVYEITNNQWTKFTNTYGSPTGSPSSAYLVNPYWTGTYVPTNNVSWCEAAQFVNWLNTSTGHQAAYKFTGTQGQSDYTLDIWSVPEAAGETNLYRHKDAFYFLPTEDEWVKAGHWNGATLQTYATTDDSAPVAGVDTNYRQTHPHFSGPWNVGSGSEELNGTYDMMGNVDEWMESPYFSGAHTPLSYRDIRGGFYFDKNLSSSDRGYGATPDCEHRRAGFRVASVPEPSTLKIYVDIKPGSCPNPVNVKSKGVLPIAILGTEDVNVLDIDPTSIAFSIGDVNVGAIRCSYEDVAAPVLDANDCNCTREGPDGYLDLTLKFKTQEIVEAIGDVNDGDVRVLTLTGVLFDPMPFETPIEGADCIVIRGKAKSLHGADINKDGVVDMADFAIFAQNWLQSSIVDE